MHTHIYVHGSFSFAGLKVHKTECALLSHSTWLRAGPWVYIDDSYQKVRPLFLRPSLVCMYKHMVCCVTRQTCLLCHTSDMSAVSQSRHVCHVTQQTCLLCHTADKSAASHSRHVCYVTQQTFLLCPTADLFAMSYSRHVCCVTQQTFLLCHTTDMSAVSHSRPADMSAVSHSRHVCCSVACTGSLPTSKVTQPTALSVPGPGRQDPEWTRVL